MINYRVVSALDHITKLKLDGDSVRFCRNFNLMSLCCMFEWNKKHLVRKNILFWFKSPAPIDTNVPGDASTSCQTICGLIKHLSQVVSAWTPAPSLHFLLWNSHHKHLTWRRYDTYCRNVSSYIKYHTCQVSIKAWIPATECETFYRWVDRGKVTKTQRSLNTFTVTDVILSSIHQVTAAAVCFWPLKGASPPTVHCK